MRTRSGVRRFGVITVVAGAALLVGVGSAAWACIGGGVASPFIDSPQPSQATAGSQVQVSGGNWAVANTVQIQWDGAGDGVLAKVVPERDGSFSRAVTIPGGAVPGVFSMIATQGDKSANPVRIEVLAADGSSTPTAEPDQPGSEVSPTGRTSGAKRTAVEPAPAVAPVGDMVQGAPAASGASPSLGVQPRTRPSTAVVAVPQAVPAGSAASAPQVLSGSDQTPASAAMASDDLWSGFANGQSRGSQAVVKLPSSAATGSPMPIGLAVLAGGLVSMFAGFGLAEMGRRRASA
ncbi:MAG TPA: hypothetical protein VMZ51_04855 [Acidimicrobiales bacterium]|nr:hypothetical protein [Acidimicrobiales bacterium]